MLKSGGIKIIESLFATIIMVCTRQSARRALWEIARGQIIPAVGSIAITRFVIETRFARH
jgi:hypothetical protein